MGSKSRKKIKPKKVKLLLFDRSNSERIKNQIAAWTVLFVFIVLPIIVCLFKLF